MAGTRLLLQVFILVSLLTLAVVAILHGLCGAGESLSGDVEPSKLPPFATQQNPNVCSFPNAIGLELFYSYRRLTSVTSSGNDQKARLLSPRRRLQYYLENNEHSGTSTPLTLTVLVSASDFEYYNSSVVCATSVESSSCSIKFLQDSKGILSQRCSNSFILPEEASDEAHVYICDEPNVKAGGNTMVVQQSSILLFPRAQDDEDDQKSLIASEIRNLLHPPKTLQSLRPAQVSFNLLLPRLETESSLRFTSAFVDPVASLWQQVQQRLSDDLYLWPCFHHETQWQRSANIRYMSVQNETNPLSFLVLPVPMQEKVVGNVPSVGSESGDTLSPGIDGTDKPSEARATGPIQYSYRLDQQDILGMLPPLPKEAVLSMAFQSTTTGSEFPQYSRIFVVPLPSPVQLQLSGNSETVQDGGACSSLNLHVQPVAIDTNETANSELVIFVSPALSLDPATLNGGEIDRCLSTLREAIIIPWMASVCTSKLVLKAQKSIDLISHSDGTTPTWSVAQWYHAIVEDRRAHLAKQLENEAETILKKPWNVIVTEDIVSLWSQAWSLVHQLTLNDGVGFRLQQYKGIVRDLEEAEDLLQLMQRDSSLGVPLDFPLDQLLAVFAPLILPLLVPLFLTLPREVQRYRTLIAKRKA
jgi:Phosphatidylinositol-glycan biosynthesis class S protein